MRLLPIILAALTIATATNASEIVWRSPTSGTLTFTEPPPELEIPDPTEPEPSTDFGIIYGIIKVRAGASLFIWPQGPSGFPPTGHMFTSSNLPTTLTLDMATGLIRGKIAAEGTYTFDVTISDDEGHVQTVLASVVVG